MKKRVLAAFVTIVLCLSCTWPAWADEDTIIEEFVLAEEPVVSDEEQAVDEAQADAETQTEIPEEGMEAGEADLSEMIIQAGGFPQAKRNTNSLILDNSSSAKEEIITGLLNKAESIDLSSYNLTVNEAQSLYSQVINENPDLFYVNSGLRWSYSGNIIYTLYPSYAGYSESQISAFNQRVEQVLASIDSSWTDVEKLMYIHDWIILNCEYDLTYSKYNAYDVIIGGSAVCQGYSLAFSVLARKIGINCSVISSENMNHAWNLVEAEGQKYFVDCTWDDPSNGITVVCRHSNFLRSKAGIESTEHIAGDWVNGMTNASAENEAVDSTMYDNCWWISLSRAAAFSGGNAYYVDEQDKTVKQYSFNTGTTENVFKCANDSWAVIDKPGYSWNGYFSNVVVRDGKYYYNTSKNIYEVNGGSSSVIYTLSDSQMKHGYIYGLELDGRNIKYNVADKQSSASYDEMFVLEEMTHVHSLERINAKAATLKATGNIEYYKCSGCGKLFTDAEGKTRTTLKKVTIPKLISIKNAEVSGIRNKTYTGKNLTQNPTVVVNGTALQKGTDYKLSYKNRMNVGTATVTIIGIGKYGSSVSKTFKIIKAANPMTVKTKAVTAKASTKTTIRRADAFAVSKAQGDVTFKKTSGNSKITVTSKGNVIVQSGLKSGETYSVQVRVTAAGSSNYKAGSKTVELKIKITK